MSDFDLSPQDLKDIEAHGLGEATAREFLQRLQQAPRFVQLQRAATRSDGVRQLDEVEALATRFDQLETVPGKFTPMSGAASRMFGFVERIAVDQAQPGDVEKMRQCNAALDLRATGPRFAFAELLAGRLQRGGQNLQAWIDRAELGQLARALLEENGLGLRGQPKAVIPFHWRDGRAVTPLEEHMREALAYAGGRLHVTISPEHRALLDTTLAQIRDQAPTLAGVQVEFSVQHPATDSVGLDAESAELVRDEDGRVAFFPAGHGALLRNVAELGRPAVLRNVDNLPCSAAAQQQVTTYHRAFAVLLAELKSEIGRLLDGLGAGSLDDSALQQGLDRLRTRGLGLHLDPDSFATADADSRRELARAALDRPLKIVGMVPNEGEPGGGPFVIASQGAEIVSIVEKDEIAAEQKQLMATGEFFNPVDLLIDPTDHRGETYDLQRFVNADRCFIVHKPYRGREILRLEHPGLWNGAMDGWNALFVAMPIETFAPVKEVVDLLRPQHQDI